ncbi:HAD family hydrolase [Erythrobacter sp.]|jgi:FMN phosphatase YigB (HAD superfamily)|uniref:HAD family hydrolase n=1 Tax=Erythrobacter sp. TaxID=1042 RepID=UPI002E9B61F1|nr:HAD family hydrolase [Erythrobacter sp.]
MTQTILPHELPGALTVAGEGIEVLSLDCFDTLLWRDCHAPSDVFAGLPAVGIAQRVAAETRARKIERTLKGRSEVGLEAIYAEAMPKADAKARTEAIAQELALEVQVCFAFAPTVELMRAAKAAGHRIVITSDTYLSAKQLCALIERAAGEEIAGLIDQVIASSDAGLSKSQGLLAEALNAMKCPAHKMLHIGDNRRADFDAARALGIRALHLAQFGEAARERLRLERAFQQLAGTGAGESGVRGSMPHRALLARDEPQLAEMGERLGFTVLGPILSGFDRWLHSEAEMLEAARGGRVHWLFMLRDGHLPYLVHREGGTAASTAAVEISRVTAIAASLASPAAYRRHVALEHGLNPPTMARQMLFDTDEIAEIVGNPLSDAERIEASGRLLDELRSGKREKITRRRARARAERLIAHVRRAVDPQPGDTLMLVDLGYNGSAQDRIDGLLSEAFDVHVAGRYLLMREMAASGLDKKGLLDARHYAHELLDALCANVAVIEQLATCPLGSVVDYTDQGEPIRREAQVKGVQSAVRDTVQAGALQFAAASARDMPILRETDGASDSAWREAAMGTLGRFLFLPHADELAVLERFEHDVNLGSERMVALFDRETAARDIRRRGLFYMLGSERMFLPAEIANESIETRLALLVQKCAGLGLAYSDGAPAEIAIPAVFLGESDEARSTVPAQPTHAGYYCTRIPVPRGAKSIALILGAVFESFQLDSVTASAVRSLKGKGGEAAKARDIAWHGDGFAETGAGVFACESEQALILVTPPEQGDEPQMIELVLRPIGEVKGAAVQGSQQAKTARNIAA